MEFSKAIKNQSKLRIALSGAAGSGKTFSAFKIASGIGGKIAVIDTERGSASLYSDRFDFDVLNLEPPYSPERYVEAIVAAEKAEYDIIVIDSLSHAWAGSGGLLDLHDSIQKSNKSGNSFSAWKEVTPLQNKLIDTVTGSKCHIISTMRTKQDYIVEQNGGRTQVRKVGLAPVQREGVEYEFTIYMELSQEHVAVASKDRTNLFDGKYFTPSEQTGRQLVEWLNKPATPSAAVALNEPQPPKPAATAAANKAPAEAQVSSPTPTRPAPSAQITIQDIARVLSPELKTLFNARRATTGQILTLFRECDGDQQKIIEALGGKEAQAA